MFAAESYTSRHYIAIVAMACLCVLLGGPSCAAGAESLFIAGATYCEPGVSGPGWAWTDADHLELNGYAGEAIGAEGDGFGLRAQGHQGLGRGNDDGLGLWRGEAVVDQGVLKFGQNLFDVVALGKGEHVAAVQVRVALGHGMGETQDAADNLLDGRRGPRLPQAA